MASGPECEGVEQIIFNWQLTLDPYWARSLWQVQKGGRKIPTHPPIPAPNALSSRRPDTHTVLRSETDHFASLGLRFCIFKTETVLSVPKCLANCEEPQEVGEDSPAECSPCALHP